MKKIYLAEWIKTSTTIDNAILIASFFGFASVQFVMCLLHVPWFYTKIAFILILIDMSIWGLFIATKFIDKHILVNVIFNRPDKKIIIYTARILDCLLLAFFSALILFTAIFFTSLFFI